MIWIEKIQDAYNQFLNFIKNVIAYIQTGLDVADKLIGNLETLFSGLKNHYILTSLTLLIIVLFTVGLVRFLQRFKVNRSKFVSIFVVFLQFISVYFAYRIGVSQFGLNSVSKLSFYVRFLLINGFLGVLFFEFHKWFKHALVRVHSSLSQLPLDRFKLAYSRGFITQLLQFFLAMVYPLSMVVLAIAYVVFLETVFTRLDSWQLSQRLGGALILGLLLYFRSGARLFYKQSLATLKRFAYYLASDIQFKRITVIEKKQLSFVMYKLLSFVLILLSSAISIALVQNGLKLILLDQFSQVLKTAVEIAWKGVGLVLLWQFARWVYASIRSGQNRVGIYARILKVGLNIDRKSVFNFIKIDRLIYVVLQSVLILVTGICIYSGVGIVLTLTPFTQSMSSVIFDSLINPLRVGAMGIISYIPNVLVIGFIVLMANYVMDFARYIFEEIEEEHFKFSGFHPDFAMPTYKIVRFLIIIFSLVIIFPYLPGSESAAFKGISVFLGILFSLGSSSMVGNIMSGIMITYMRPFKVGDRVKIADTLGDVVSKNLLVTRIKTIKNVYIAIPNAQVLGGHITNYSFMNKDVPIILHTTVTIGYDVDWKVVHRLLTDAALSTPNILKEPKPFVNQTALSDFYVEYELNAYTHSVSEMSGIYSDLHQAIQNQFRAEDVEILSPHYRMIRQS